MKQIEEILRCIALASLDKLRICVKKLSFGRITLSNYLVIFTALENTFINFL